MSNGYWFRPKYFGYGTGLPLNWKGWLHLAVLIAGVSGGLYLIRRFLPHGDWNVAEAIGFVAFVFPMIVIAARKTEGGWHWRWRG
jgi:hypothetical protein